MRTAPTATRSELERHRRRIERLGATLRLDRPTTPGEPLHVLADLSGHPFCILVV